MKVALRIRYAIDSPARMKQQVPRPGKETVADLRRQQAGQATDSIGKHSSMDREERHLVSLDPGLAGGSSALQHAR
jgi:hypothetical protein